jgi:hypothetical protein
VATDFATYGAIGGLTRWSRATPDDRAAQRDVLRSALAGKHERDALEAFRAKGHEPTTRELAEAAERLRRAAQLRAAMAGGRARRERAERERSVRALAR